MPEPHPLELNFEEAVAFLRSIPEFGQPMPQLILTGGDADFMKFFAACDECELVLFSAFLMTGFRQQEVMCLLWSDVSLDLRTVRVTAKRDLGFAPKRWEEREVPITTQLAGLLADQPRTSDVRFVSHRRPGTGSSTCSTAAKPSRLAQFWTPPCST